MDNLTFSYKKYCRQLDDKYLEALKIVVDDSREYRYLDEVYRDDYYITFVAISDYNANIEYASERLQGNKKLIFLAIRYCPEIPKIIIPMINNDEEFLLELIKYRITIIQYVSDEIRDNFKIMLAAVKLNGIALKYASDELCKNREIVKAAVSSNGNAIKYAHEDFKCDFEIAHIAISNCSYMINNIHPDLQQNKDLLKIVANDGGTPLNFQITSTDRDFILELININPYFYRYVVDKSDEEILRIAISKRGVFLKYAKDKLDRDLVLAAVKNNGKALKYAPDLYRYDYEIVSTAIETNVYSLEYIPDIFKKDYQFAKKAALWGESIIHHLSEFKKDFYLNLLAVNSCYWVFCEVDYSLRDDKDFVLEFISDSVNLKYVSPRLQDDFDVVFAAVKNCGLQLRFASNRLKKNMRIIQHIFKINNGFKFIHPDVQKVLDTAQTRKEQVNWLALWNQYSKFEPVSEFYDMNITYNDY